MLRITNIKLPYSHSQEELLLAIRKKLHLNEKELHSVSIRKKALDCRKKPDLYYVYTADVSCEKEDKILKRARKQTDIQKAAEESYRFVTDGSRDLKERPLIIGSGPAGLFCGLALARAGYQPLIIERGKDVLSRSKDVEAFWKKGILDPESNAQFGEGGAGTFSDGKLNTLVRDKNGFGRKVLEEFVHFGADPDIMIYAKPHVGTDTLVTILQKMRQEIESYGGNFLFQTKMTDLQEEKKGIIVSLSNGEKLHSQAVVLAIGNSARDTFLRLKERKLPMEAKAFAVGLRIEHPQEMINLNAYGKRAGEAQLPPSPYKVTGRSKKGRGVYSFCMCPGGYVINASSREGYTAVNGMSYHDRAGENANSAIILTVDQKDFGGEDILAGMRFQEKLEENAYRLGQGAIPQQLLKDFAEGKESRAYGEVISAHKGKAVFADLNRIFPEGMSEELLEGIQSFTRQIPDFAMGDAVLSGVESRTSSPVRMLRGKEFESEMRHIYPCGEGAGYAGGIVSAAMDGLRTAQAIAHVYRPISPCKEMI